ncbi:helix-turn-helix domain-containing protein [Streptomyces acidiscabies]|uniref:XRE family transcriptional regulator n=1 Tax=Streptomyces acidiscabies TaxID=42234 RepID=A0A0L0KH04_9ACTN|nr:helix-turn-helix transcriptional regulator [Streptomyces acidiscabies]KND36884.1 XRE family transcriptional regulator [Streptomyces acidiscabies]
MAKQKDLDLPTSPRVFLGRELKHAREEKGYSQTGLGEVLFVSGSYVGQMEVGIRRIRPEMGPPLDKELGTGTFFTRHSKELAKSKYADHFAEAVEAEREAATIKQHVPSVIPGLLQTPAYAKALFRAYDPLAPDAHVDKMVEDRMARAQLFDDPTPPLFWCILDESTLRRRVGGAQVLAENLRHVAGLVRRKKVIVQVVPFSAEGVGGLHGLMKLMYFPDAPPLLYLEGTGFGYLFDDPGRIARAELTFELLMADALPLQDSLALIEAMAEDYEHEAQH